MRSRSRTTAATVLLLVAAVLVGLLLAGCADGPTGPERDEEPAAGPMGDVPGSPVLPDELAVSQDGDQLLADCWQGICRWNTSDGSLAAVDDGSHVALSADWSLIAGVGADATVLLVDAGSGDVVHELGGHDDYDGQTVDGSPIHDIAFSADGSLVAAAGPGGRVIVWAVDDGSEVTTIDTGAGTSALAFSPDGSRLATAGGAPVRIFDVTSGELAATLPDSSPEASGLAWSSNGRWLAGPGPGAAPAVWSTRDLALVAELDDSSLNELVFAPDSRTLAVTDTDDDTIRLWSPAATAGARGGDDRVRELVGHTDQPGAVVFAPDGATLYSVAGPDGIFAWTVRTGELAQELELPEG